jgi:hypothetical protein
MLEILTKGENFVRTLDHGEQVSHSGNGTNITLLLATHFETRTAGI